MGVSAGRGGGEGDRTKLCKADVTSIQYSVLQVAAKGGRTCWAESSRTALPSCVEASSCVPKRLEALDSAEGEPVLLALGRKWRRGDSGGSGCFMKSPGRLSLDSGRDARGGA